jgi:hypothetical protein
MTHHYIKILFLILVISCAFINDLTAQHYSEINPHFRKYSFANNSTTVIYADSIEKKVYFIGDHFRYGDSISDAVIVLDLLIDSIFIDLKLPRGTYIKSFAKFKGKTYVGGYIRYNYNLSSDHFIYLLNYDQNGWDTLLLQPNHQVTCLYEHDGKLFAGGTFTSIGGKDMNKIAWFDGQNWHPLMNGNCFDINSTIYSIIYYKGFLYAAGTISDTCNNNINQLARFNGVNWESVPRWSIGKNSVVEDLCIFQDKLYVSGRFFASDGESLGNNIVYFDGVNWFSPSYGSNYTMNKMVVGGDRMYVSGTFNLVGGIKTNAIATWDGVKWCSIDSALIEINGYTICATLDGNLFLAGGFKTIGKDSFYRHAIWSGINHSDTCSFSLSYILNENDFDNVLVYPNPSSDVLTIQLEENNGVKQFDVICSDLMGRIVLQFKNTDGKQLDVSQLASGTYILSLSYKEEIRNLKFVKL